jgi:dTDP-glucose 4,6-dehydratase
VDAPRRDLDEILAAAGDDLRRFANARLYVTGGTGFVGRWLLAALAHANERLATKIRADVLTRDPEAFARAVPSLASNPAFRLVRGDVAAPVADGAYDGVVHAATPASAALNDAQPETMLAVIVDGVRGVLRDVVEPSGSIPVLFTSSGAVYGRQPPELARVPEAYGGGPDPLDPRSAYHEGKRVAELAFAIAQARGAGRVRVARLFAFLGPGLPLDAHFAAGNFVRDALGGGPVRVGGDGTPYRSYLYPTDMIAWCLAVFARGADARAYNVGSADAVTVGELAARVARAAGDGVTVEIARAPVPNAPAERYVPDPARIVAELGVRQTVGLDDAIARTVSAHRDQRAKTSSAAT